MHRHRKRSSIGRKRAFQRDRGSVGPRKRLGSGAARAGPFLPLTHWVALGHRPDFPESVCKRGENDACLSRCWWEPITEAQSSVLTTKYVPGDMRTPALITVANLLSVQSRFLEDRFQSVQR